MKRYSVAFLAVLAGLLSVPLSAFAQTPQTVSGLTTEITGIVTSTVPDLGIYIAVGVVLVLAVSMARKFIRVGGR